ncbi:MAG: AraC family transcriptional regulator, partial [Candidatus Rokuibacteriota bacterium]
MDPLSDVLRAVRLTGALFFRVEARMPWGLALPDGATLAPSVLPRAQHVISYHVVTEGACWGLVHGETPVRLTAGDVLVLPRGDAYAMSMTPGVPAGPDRKAVLAFMRQMAAGQLPFTITEGGTGADRLHLVCGFLGCDVRPFNPLLATLPRLLHVRRAVGPAGDPLGQLIDLTLREAREPRAGGECVRLRLSELIFVEVVRRHLATLPAEETGWLAALRDPAVGGALARLHEQPARAWTLDALARDVGRSRSALADRFTHLVGQPPMQYLTRWRMQVAARLLAEDASKVSAVGREVGYESEAAFSRAFKKVTGVAPGAWRARRAPPVGA